MSSSTSRSGPPGLEPGPTSQQDWTCAPSKTGASSCVEGRRGRRVGGRLSRAAIFLAVVVPFTGCAALGAGGGWDPEAARAEAQVHEQAGWTRLKKGDARGALVAFDQAKRTDPTYYAPYIGSGRSYYELRDVDLEIAEYHKCLAMHPDCVEAWVQLGDAHASRDSLADARHAYEQALRAGETTGTPVHRRVRYNLAIVLRDLGELGIAWAVSERLAQELKTAPPRTDRSQADELREWLGSQAVRRALREGVPPGAAEQ